jgi:RNA polymerase sigma-70 factor (ECF subfamily)
MVGVNGLNSLTNAAVVGVEADAALAIRARAGDRAAFETLLRRHARRVFARLYVATRGDAHRADDLVQETFVRAWQRLADLHEPAKFVGWVEQIADHALIDAARRIGAIKRGGERAKPQAADALDEVPDPRDSPLDRASDAESKRRAIDALASLPEAYRLPLTLRYLNDANYDDMARQLGISNGSLRGLLARGLAMLREKLAASDTTNTEQRR